MIAGLLGEHLASPRTATKTNQNTALETKTTRDSTQPSEEGFAAYVAKDSDSANPETPNAEEAIAATGSTTATNDAPTPGTISGELTGEIADLDLAQNEGAETEISTADRAQNTQSDTIKAEAITPDSLMAKDASRTDAAGEIEVAAEDPRIRAATSTQDTVPSGVESAANKNAHPAAEQAPETVARVAETTAPKADPALKVAQDTVKPGQDSIPQVAETTADSKASRVDHAAAARAEADATDAEALRAARANDNIDGRLAAEANTHARMAAADANGTDATATPVISRDTPLFGGEPTVTIGLASSSGSAPMQVNVGLTPTPASIPVASPGDLTSVIVNAIKNGADPQEQLVVQLDPPELGRVMIDFKFDAQGMQQITVTAENPEALKRLREMHFELTQALRENGLSDQNMSFSQGAGEQSRNAWQTQDQQRAHASLIAAEDRRASPSATQILPNSQARDRLDLLL